MIYSSRIKNKNGFTVVELVIVLIVLVILAAILIPSFIKTMESARASVDKSTVNNMNKILFSEDPAGSGKNFDKAKKVIEKNGYDIPCSPKKDNYSFYWMKDSDRVVLYDNDEAEVIFPEEYTSKEKSDDWIDISKKYSPSDPETEDEPAQTAEEPTELDLMLPSGKSFLSKIKTLTDSPTKIVFDRIENHEDKLEGKSILLSEKEGITAYLSNNQIFILSKGDISANADCSGMFSGLSSLNSIVFNNFNTSAVTDMSSMFKGCSSIANLDIAFFNTANVTNMNNMFYGCSKLNTITVSSAWSISKVSSGSNMFKNCDKLLKNSSSIDYWFSWFLEIFGWDDNNDKYGLSFADTSKDYCYLTLV